jgi:archaeosine-15-forming tRNA-guanine transglycosylase
MTMTLAMPTPATSRATAPRPRKREVKALSASAWAVRAADGWLTLTCSGLAGLAALGSRPWVSITWLGTERT